MEWTQKTNLFFSLGLDLSTATDRMKQGKYQRYRDLIVVQDGVLEPRPGVSSKYLVAGNKTPVHSAIRLHDGSSGTSLWSMIYGVQDEVQIEKSTAPGSTTVVSTGHTNWSPFSLITYQPPKSPQSWAYVGDATKMRKVNVAGTLHEVGLPIPNAHPEVVVSDMHIAEIDYFEGATPGGWTMGGTNAPTAINGGTAGTPRINTTIAAIIAESNVSTLRFLNVIKATSMVNITPGTIFPDVPWNSIPGTEDVLVQEVHRASTSTTINRVVYDSGTTGRCCVTFTNVLREAELNSMLYNSTRGERVRVKDVITNSDESMAVIVTTTVGWADGDTVQLEACFVCHTQNEINPASSLISYQYEIVVASGNGYIQRDVALDLSKLTYASTSGSVLDDYMSICAKISDPENLVQISLELSIIDTTYENYYHYVITPSDLTSLLEGQQSAVDNRQTQIQRRQLDPTRKVRQVKSPYDPYAGVYNDPDPIGGTEPVGGEVTAPGSEPDAPRAQLPPGKAWGNARWLLSAMQRVGTDAGSLKDVKSIRIRFQTSAAMTVTVDSWCLWGGGPIDVGLNSSIQYKYRGRCSSTGVVSDWSEPSEPIRPRRQNVSLSLTAHPSTECDKLDIARIGGGIDQWAYIATIDNSGTYRYDDNTSLIAAFEGTQYDTTGAPDLQPFVTLGLPASGTITSASGTIVKSAGAFNLAWAPGTFIVVGNTPTIIQRMVSTSVMHVSFPVPALGAVDFEVPEPWLVGQPLPVLVGPWFDYIFGFGDSLNPHVIYWWKRASESMMSRNWKSACSPSEVLMNGFLYNGRFGILSNERQFVVEFSEGSSDPFSFSEIPNSKGLAARWAIASGRHGVAYLGDDGVYLTTGGPSESITGDLAPLFRTSSRAGTDTNGVAAPYIDFSEEKYLRMWFGDDESLYFAYRDTSGARHCLRYEFDGKRWTPYTFGVQIEAGYALKGRGVAGHYLLGADTTRAKVYELGGGVDDGTDNGTAIPCTLRTPYDNVDNPRAEKQFGDVTVTLDPGGAAVTVQVLFDDGTVLGPSIIMSGTGKQVEVIDLGTTEGEGVFARNIALDISWSNGVNHHPVLHQWEFTYISHPEDTFKRATDWDFAGTHKMKYITGLHIECDTEGANKTVQVQYDSPTGPVNGPLLTINSTGRAVVVFPRTGGTNAGDFTPFRAHMIRLICTDTNDWKLYSWKWQVEAEPEDFTGETPWDDAGTIDMKYVQGVKIEIDTYGVDKLLQVQYDSEAGPVNGPLLTVNTNGRHIVTVFPRPGVDFDPFRAHKMRLVSSDADRCVLYTVKWVYETEPEEDATYYETQETTFDTHEYKFIYEVWIAYRSTAAVTLTLQADGSAITGIPTLPSTGGAYAKTRVIIPPKLFKAVKFILESTAGFGLYQRDCSVQWKTMSGGGGYSTANPFGEMSRDRGGARI